MKKKYIFIFILILALILFFIFNFVLANTDNKIEETTIKNPFKIEKIIFYSNCSFDNTSSTSSSTINLDLSQFTDIAIYLKQTDSNLTQENTVSNIYIDNVSISKSDIGNQILYSKNIKDFGKLSYLENNEIQDKFTFPIAQSQVNYENFEISYDLKNPLVIGYYNKSIKPDLVINNTDNLRLDGSLLKKARIPLNYILCSVSFDIHITNNLGENFIINFNRTIPLEDENNSIYDGEFYKEEIM